MANYPNNFSGQERLQPGGRGERFNANLPGYRTDEDRINRTNTKLNAAPHDTLNIKYQLDHRLPPLFRYGFAYGYNQMVIPKGRIVAVDPHMDLVDFDMHKQHNVLTIANGGVASILRDQETYQETGGETDIVTKEAQGKPAANAGIEWAPVQGFDLYNKYTLESFKEGSSHKQLTENGYDIDERTGTVKDEEGNLVSHVRPGNIPVGVIQRNEYTRDDGALNGMMAGPIVTDKLIEFPWFAFKDKAEGNPWGSAYGGLFPGALVKSDENGRFIPSPLSIPELVEEMTISEYEFERQQVVGQIYSVNHELVPEGSAKWATWALKDRLNFDEFNPAEWKQNYRRNEDAINNSPYMPEGKYPGHPYDRSYMESDLHMINNSARQDNYDLRMNQEFQYDNLGIPGLTDGKNVASRKYDLTTVGRVHKASEGEKYVEMIFRATEVDVENMEVKIGDAAKVDAVVGQTVSGLEITYVDNKQGLIKLEVVDAEAFEEAVGNDSDGIEIQIGFDKRGLSGVPTFLDWDGVVGSVKVLLTK